MAKCPACKTKLKLSGPQLLKFFKSRPCPQCGTMLVRKIWPNILFGVGGMMAIGTGDVFDKVLNLRRFVTDKMLFRKIDFTLMILWGIAVATMMMVGLFFAFRLYVTRPQDGNES